MSRRFRTPIAALVAGLLTIFGVAAQESSLPPPGTDTYPTEPEPVRQWLDEVRAQRLMREERRRAAKEAIDARRRWINPWHAAQQERREQETQRRRDAFMEYIERDRETFSNLVPWGFRQSPWQDEISEPPAGLLLSPGMDATEVAGEAEPSASPYPLPGWNNRWYYRGF